AERRLYRRGDVPAASARGARRGDEAYSPIRILADRRGRLRAALTRDARGAEYRRPPGGPTLAVRPRRPQQRTSTGLQLRPADRWRSNHEPARRCVAGSAWALPVR